MDKLTKALSSVEAEYRAHPFWSWNDRLDPEELRRQVRLMSESGLGGFFMHARSGLETPYMGDEWFTCIRACIDEAGKCGMEPWSYDENGWPSGSANGMVAAHGVDYHVRNLSCALCDGEVADGDTASESGRTIGYYAVGSEGGGCRALGRTPSTLREGERLCRIAEHTKASYIDILNPVVVRAFIDSTYEEYRKRLGDSFGGDVMPGFFTDEPQYALCVAPWSTIFADEFKAEYGYDLLPLLPLLYLPLDGCAAVRYDYWRLVNRLFTESFAKQIYEWCEEHGCRFTGHAMMEDNLFCQMHCTAGAMPMYEYMHIPGMDWLARWVSNPITPKQVSSVARQTGKKLVISEMYAMCGWDISFEEARWIAEWQYLNGINLTCQHLAAYSLRGNRKQDFPPSMFYQQPWFGDYRAFNDYIARLGKLLAEGEEVADALLVHPMHSCWAEFTPLEMNTCIKERDDEFVRAVGVLADNHVLYHFGDETVMARHGDVRDGKFIVGNCAYSMVFLPGITELDSSTVSLLERFLDAGGRVAALGSLPIYIDGRDGGERLATLCARFDRVGRDAEEILAYLSRTVKKITISGARGEEKLIHYTKRVLADGRNAYFLLNLNRDIPCEVRVSIPGERGGARLDLDTLEYAPLDYSLRGGDMCFNARLEPMQSMLVIAGEDIAPAEDAERGTVTLRFGRKYRVAECDNVMVLDRAEYAPDGLNFSETLHPIGCSMAFGGRECTDSFTLRHRFTVRVGTDISRLRSMRLAIEYHGCTVRVNGGEAVLREGEWWLDHGFPVYDIGQFVREGENEICLSGCFTSRRGDKLVFGGGLAPAYLLGDFGVFSLSSFIHGEKRSVITDGYFVLGDRPEIIDGGDLVQQGFPFFGGKITLEQTFNISRSGLPCRFDIGHPYAALAALSVNGKNVKTIMWRGDAPDITPYLREGENRVAVTLTIGNRNILGPFHLPKPEPYDVGPDDFGPYEPSKWRERYAFAKTGMGE